jgi:hypothetical protein
MATRPKGYLTKGKTNSADAMRKSKARASLTPRGIAGIVGNAVLNSPAGRAGKVAKFAGRTGAKIIAERKGASILAEKAARTTKKPSNKVVKALAREATGPKAKGPGASPSLTKSSKPLNRAIKLEKTVVVQRTGNKPGQFKNVEKFNKKPGVSPERATTATEKQARNKTVTVKKMTAAI